MLHIYNSAFHHSDSVFQLAMYPAQLNMITVKFLGQQLTKNGTSPLTADSNQTAPV